MKSGSDKKRLWTLKEDLQLREMATAGKSVNLMALSHKRTEAAIRGRLAMLGISLRKLKAAC